MKRLLCFLLLLASSPAWATAYFIAPSGVDTNSGLSTGLPWLSPNHAVNCGDTITAASGTYASSNFATGKWGTVTCASGNNVAWLQCATFDACKITATGSDAMWIDSSYWGVQGFENSTNTTTNGACFHVGPSGNTVVHHVIFANDVANGCMGGGFTAYSHSTTGSVDYIVYLGDIAYNAAQGSGACYSGLNVYQPIAFDTVAGTHIYVAGSFAYANKNPATCNGTAPTDGEGINFDTFDFSQGGGTAYTQQAVAKNNISFFNGGRGIYSENNAAGTTHAAIYFLYNTVYGNNIDANQTTTCSGAGDLAAYNVKNVTMEFNIVQTNSATGCASNAKYAMSLSTGDATDVIDYNFAAGVSGNNTFLYSSGAFAYGSHNTLGTSPSFTSATNPGAPSCGSASSVPNCMATVISNYAASAGGASVDGYQAVSNTSVNDPLYPAWLCTVTIPLNLVTPGCGAAGTASPGSVTGAITSGVHT